MSDENEGPEDDEQPPQMFMIGGMPPEVLEQMRLAHEHQHAVNEAAGHQVVRAYEEMSIEHLEAMRMVVMNMDGPASVYHVTLIHAILCYRQNLCLACGKDHDAQLEELAGGKISTDGPADQLQPAAGSSSDMGSSVLNADGDDPALLKKFGLVRDASTHELICANCESVYPSIEDRARRPAGPGGCEGCTQKAKWG